MPGRLILPLAEPVLDNDGRPDAGALLYAYEAGTTTLANWYADRDLTVPLQNPQVADVSGRLYLQTRVIWLGDDLYDFMLRRTDGSFDVYEGLSGVLDAADIFLGGMTWSEFEEAAVPETVTRLFTSGYETVGLGAAFYTLDPDQTDSAPTRVRRKSASGRWFKLDEPTISPEMVGALGDGVTDDTAALNAWSDAMRDLNSNGMMPTVTYRCSQAAFGIRFDGHRGTMIDGGGATLKTLDGDPVTSGQAGLYFNDCQDMVIENLTYDANRATRTPAETGSFSIHLHENLKRLHFRNVRSINSVVDGWYLRGTTSGPQDTYPTDILLEDCTAETAYRNGLSAIGTVRLTILRGRYVGTTGTLPKAGIDIEPNASDSFGNIGYRIIDVDVSENDGYGLAIGGNSQCLDGIVSGLTGQSNGFGLIQLGANVNNLKIINPMCGPHSGSAVIRGLIDVGDATTRISISGAKFRGIAATFVDVQCCIYVHAGSSNVDIENAVAVTTSLPLMILRSPGIKVDGFEVTDCTAAYPAADITAAATRAQVSAGRSVRPTNIGIALQSPGMKASDIYVEDSASTVSAIRLYSTATNADLMGHKVHATGAIPGGQYAARLDAAPASLIGFTATGGYTDNNTINATVSLAASRIAAVTPDPFSRTFTWDPPSLAGGATASTIVTLGYARLLDAVVVRPPYDLQGIMKDAAVSSDGNVKVVLFNPPAAATVDLASGSWIVSLRKA